MIYRKKFSYKNKNIIIEKNLNVINSFFDFVYKKLNQFLNVNYDRRFWKILIYKELLYLSENLLIKNYIADNFEKNNNYIYVPFSSNDLYKMAQDGCLINSIKKIANIDNTNIKIYKKNYNNNKLNLFFLFIDKYFKNFKKFYLDFFNIKLFFLLILKGYLPIFFDKFRSSEIINDHEIGYNFKMRKKLYDYSLEEIQDKKQIALLRVICFLLPITKFELFKTYDKFYSKSKPESKNIFMTSNVNYSDRLTYFISKNHQIFKFFFYYQYGSGIGTAKNHHYIMYNIDNFENILSWNSISKINGKKNIQMPFFYKFKNKSYKKIDILLVNSDWPFFF